MCTVKTTYHVALNLKSVVELGNNSSNSQVSHPFWKTIWNLKLPNKINNLKWRACGNSMPTKYKTLFMLYTPALLYIEIGWIVLMWEGLIIVTNLDLICWSWKWCNTNHDDWFLLSKFLTIAWGPEYGNVEIWDYSRMLRLYQMTWLITMLHM